MSEKNPALQAIHEFLGEPSLEVREPNLRDVRVKIHTAEDVPVDLTGMNKATLTAGFSTEAIQPGDVIRITSDEGEVRAKVTAVDGETLSVQW